VALEEGRRPGPATSALDGRPGTRTPRAPAAPSASPRSTVVDGRFALLAGPDAGAWCDPAKGVAKDLRVRVDCERGAAHGELGVRPDGALLVPPDGIVAWRSRRAGLDTGHLHRWIRQAPDDGRVPGSGRRGRLLPLGHERRVVALVEVDPPSQRAVPADLRPAASVGLAAVVVANPGELDAAALEAAVDTALDGDHLEVAGAVGRKRDVRRDDEIEAHPEPISPFR
jgi:hypothetical protein